MSDGSVAVFPNAWLRRLEGLPRALTLDAAGYPLTVELDRDALIGVYLPLLALLHDELDDRRRIVVALAGIPGGGKSTFASVLARLADVLLGMGRLMAVGMDGWHWPNAVLDARTTVDDAGAIVPLRQRKGGPDSFDVESMAAAVRQLQAGHVCVSLPVYDRRLHEPVANGITVGPGTSIVLIEGNFLLRPQPPWKAVSDLFQLKLFLECDIAAARDRVIARHIRGGASPEQAARKFETNDRQNTQAVLATAARADYVIRFLPQAEIAEPQ